MLQRAPQLLVCAAAALAALAHAQDPCNTAVIGNMTDDAYNLEERRVAPDMFTLEISEPEVCPDSDPVGLKVMACDSDLAPRVYLVDTTRGLVVRDGNLGSDIYVYVTVYCEYDPNEFLSESSESPNTVSRFSTLQLTSSPSLSAWASGPSSISVTPPPISPVESTTIPPMSSESSPSENTLPKIQLESRFAAVPAVGKLSAPENKALWKQYLPPLPGKPKLPSLINMDLVVPNWREELETGPLKKGFIPNFYDSYESFMKDIPWAKNLVPSFAKRFSETQPEHSPPWFPNGSPPGLKHPVRRPSPRGFRHPVWGTRRSMSRMRRRPSGRSYDEGYQWSPYEEDPMSLHWSEEPSVQSPESFRWGPENQPIPHSAHGVPSRLKHPQLHNFKGGYPGPVLPERPPPVFARHPMKQPTQHLPSLNEDDPSQLAEWKDQAAVITALTKRRIVPKLLLLLQEQEDHSVTSRQKCDSPPAVEDGEPWWQNPPPEQSPDSVPYLSDYTADDSDPWASNMLPGRYDDNEHMPGSPTPEWCSRCNAPHPSDDDGQFHHPHYPPSRYNTDLMPGAAPAHDSQLSPDDFRTERPMMSSTIRHSVSWVKSSQPATSQRANGPGEQAQAQSAEPWSFLSKLLLSHPTFRDSTHVIRI